MGLGITARFDAAYFTGTPSVRQVPHPYMCALGGHPYMISLDPNANEAWGVRLDQQGVPLLRDQVDQSDQVGEQSLSPTGLWRRSMGSWHRGAGQLRYDAKTSDTYRFASSLGVNPWVQGQLSLLDGIRTTFATYPVNAVSVVAGSRWYIAAGTTLSYVGDLSGGSSIAITGSITGAAVSIDSDGRTVWVAQGTGGLIYTDITSGAVTGPWFSGSPNITCVGFAKGRLFVADSAGNLYNPVAAAGSALPTALVTTGAGAGVGVGGNWTWTDIADGPNAVYACGFRGDKSWVYAITINSNGTSVNVPFIADRLPDGEIARSLYTYLGFLVIGTDKGVRVAQPDASGNLTIGGLLPVGPVYGFTGQDRFVWFTWSNAQPGSGGVGRMDLSQEIDTLTFAYASDLMYSDANSATQVICRSVCTFLGATVFTYEKSGATRAGIPEVGAPVPTGFLNTGTITYGLVDTKAAQFVDVRHDPLLVGTSAGTTSAAAVGVQLSTDGSLYAGLGYSKTAGSTGAGDSLPANGAHGESFALKITLVAGGITPPVQALSGGPTSAIVTSGFNGADGTSPVLRRVTLRSLGESTRISERIIPLQLRRRVANLDGIARYCDFSQERAYLEGLFKSGLPFSYQEGSFSVLVTMYDIRWLAERVGDPAGNFEGVFVAHLRDIQ